jgi:hypothetical protein
MRGIETKIQTHFNVTLQLPISANFYVNYTQRTCLQSVTNQWYLVNVNYKVSIPYKTSGQFTDLRF